MDLLVYAGGVGVENKEHGLSFGRDDYHARHSTAFAPASVHFAQGCSLISFFVERLARKHLMFE